MLILSVEADQICSGCPAAWALAAMQLLADCWLPSMLRNSVEVELPEIGHLAAMWQPAGVLCLTRSLACCSGMPRRAVPPAMTQRWWDALSCHVTDSVPLVGPCVTLFCRSPCVVLILTFVTERHLEQRFAKQTLGFRCLVPSAR
jgi:hypothetical protein